MNEAVAVTPSFAESHDADGAMLFVELKSPPRTEHMSDGLVLPVHESSHSATLPDMSNSPGTLPSQDEYDFTATAFDEPRRVLHAPSLNTFAYG